MGTRLALALCAVALGHFAHAYPIPSRPLRRLVIDAEFIVVAAVEKTAIRHEEKDHWASGMATLRISSILKGHRDAKVISVYFAAFVMCPAPARYVEGKTVLAFLNRRKNGEGYRTYALSYGAKTPDNADMKVYVARVKELLAILKEDGGKQTARTVDWLVRCAEHPATRWEGLRDLVWPTHGRRDGKSVTDPAFHPHLTGPQRARLVAVLKTLRPTKHGLPYDAATIMSILAKTEANDQLGAFAERFRKIHWEDADKIKKQKAVVAEFIAQYERAPNR